MQFSVPQFTDVEDKIIGPLTLKQFGIIFGASVFVFLGYSASGKSLTVLIVLGLIFGLPAVVIAFVKYNGRPLYNSFGQFYSFFTSDKVLIFHKEVRSLGSQKKLKDAQINLVEKVQAEVLDPQAKLKDIHSKLLEQEREEKELLGKIR